jgi:hypothetical protein
VVSWDPVNSSAGFVGPFSNPSFVIGLLLAVALVLSVCRVSSAARLVAALAIVASVVIGLLGLSLGWQGPSLSTAALFAAFGAGGMSTSNRISRGIVLVAASLCAVLSVLSLETMQQQSVYQLSPFWSVEVIVAIAGAVAAVLLAWPWRRRRVSRT